MAFDSNAVLKASSTETASANGTGLQVNGTAVRGMTAIMNVTAASGTTPTLDVVVQHSDDNSTFTDLATFDQVSDEGISQVRFATDKQYIRTASTIAGTSPSFTYSVDVTL